MVTAITEVESVLCIVIGFALTYLFLELAWHFTACKIKDGTTLKPCLFTELRNQVIFVRNRL